VGSGKGVLWLVVLAPASVVENLIPGPLISCSIMQDIVASCKAGQASMAYFYFNFKDVDKQNRRYLLLFILAQLSAQSDPCFDFLFFEPWNDGSGAQTPCDEVLTQCLKEMLLLTGHDPTYIVVDALGEYPNASSTIKMRTGPSTSGGSRLSELS
jgi:hypothetical protein